MTEKKILSDSERDQVQRHLKGIVAGIEWVLASQTGDRKNWFVDQYDLTTAYEGLREIAFITGLDLPGTTTVEITAEEIAEYATARQVLGLPELSAKQIEMTIIRNRQAGK